MSLVQTLKNLDTNREQLDDLVYLHEQAKLLRNGYAETQMDTPDWLVGALDTLDTEIKRQSHDILMLRLKELDQAEHGLKTAGERRQEIAEQKAKLLKRLGKDAPTPVTA